MALTFERISAPFVLRLPPPFGACGSRVGAPGSGSAQVCGCPLRAVSRLRLSTLAGVVELDHLPLELVGEMSRVPGVSHAVSRLSSHSRSCPHQCGQFTLMPVTARP